MTPDDTRAFRAALRRLEIAYGCPVDAARDPVYFDALAHFPLATVVRAADDLANRHRTASGRFPITHDWIDRCRELAQTGAARQRPQHATPIEPVSGPSMTKAEFCARLETLRRKLARARPPGRRHSSLTPLAQIADSLTHPHAVAPPAELSRTREPSEDDLPLDDTPVQPDGAEDDPDAV